MPLISGGGGGGSFNGGTITERLAIIPTAASASTLLGVDAFTGQSGDLFRLTADSGTAVMEVFPNGGTYLATETNTEIVLYVDGVAAPDQSSDVMRVVDKNNNRVIVCPADGPPQLALGLATTAISSGALPTVGPVSGTAFQCSTARDVVLVVPVTYNPGVATTATCKVELSPDNVTFSTLITITQPVGTVFDGSIEPVQLAVPAAWFVKLTVTNATIGAGTFY